VKGGKAGGSRPMTSKGVGGDSLNDEAMESLWHSEFDFRRYALMSKVNFSIVSSRFVF
jgi:hypothetical protein